jgi:hypothetical protein
MWPNDLLKQITIVLTLDDRVEVKVALYGLVDLYDVVGAPGRDVGHQQGR